MEAPLKYIARSLVFFIKVARVTAAKLSHKFGDAAILNLP